MPSVHDESAWHHGVVQICSLQDLSMHSCCAGPWLQEFTDLRDKINTAKLEIEIIRSVVAELDVRIPKTGRNYPIPKLSERALARMEREAAMAGRSSLFCQGLHAIAPCRACMQRLLSCSRWLMHPVKSSYSNNCWCLTISWCQIHAAVPSIVNVDLWCSKPILTQLQVLLRSNKGRMQHWLISYLQTENH